MKLRPPATLSTTPKVRWATARGDQVLLHPYAGAHVELHGLVSGILNRLAKDLGHGRVERRTWTAQ